MRWQPSGRLATFTLSLLVSGGCHRPHYRLQADRDVALLVAEKAQESCWATGKFPTEPGPESRLFDPFDPDHPPMPPDDPAAHRLMHHVDGKNGWKGWHRDGDSDCVDAGTWESALPRDETGRVVLDHRAAVQVALLNSREYRNEIEDLYLSALDVSFERFRFDTQFFGGHGSAYEADGRLRPGGDGDSASRLGVLSTAEANRLTATGGELVVGLANSFLWQFSGTDSLSARSIVDFSIFQPLLRLGGRAVVLERLTLAERNLLANVRQMEHFRQGFYVQVLTGRGPGEGPARVGPIGVRGLGLVAGPPGGRTGAADAGGFFGLLREQQEIRNQAANAAALRDSVMQLEAAFDAGRIPNRLQVDQARQALNNAQSRLLTLQAGYRTRLDAFKVGLGLPPRLEVLVRDPIFDRFELVEPRMIDLESRLSQVLNGIRQRARPETHEELDATLTRLLAMREPIGEQVQAARGDVERLRETLPARRQHLRRLAEREEVRRGELDPDVVSEATFERRVETLAGRLDRLEPSLQAVWMELDRFRPELRNSDYETSRRRLIGLATDLSSRLLQLSLDRAALRVEAIVLSPIDLSEDDAVTMAREQRLDWMNARARLVDVWRRITVDANALQSDLNLTLSGDLQSAEDNPLRFRSETGRLRAGIEFDAPITRRAERNAYRESLIAYQRARRDYLLFEDQVSQSLRNTLRLLSLVELNFELSRAAVHVAISQVDLARLRLNQPPQPGQQAQFGATTARDLVSGLSDLLNAQNDFLSGWVNYQMLRLLLDFELGLETFDSQGVGGPGSSTDVDPILSPVPEGIKACR